MIGTAWVITGWTTVGGTVFLFGFLFFYDVTPYLPSTATATTTIAASTTIVALSSPTTLSSMNSTLLSTIMLSTRSPITSTTSTALTTPSSVSTTKQPLPMLCGIRGDGLSSRLAQSKIFFTKFQVIFYNRKYFSRLWFVCEFKTIKLTRANATENVCFN